MGFELISIINMRFLCGLVQNQMQKVQCRTDSYHPSICSVNSRRRAERIAGLTMPIGQLV